MIETFLSKVFISQWLVFGFNALLLLALAEAGYRGGIASRRKSAEQATGHSGSVQGAVLGLLGLLLGFSFAMAVGRHDTRRALVVDEANSIGTTWLRADFLPQPHQQQVKELLRRYTELKLARLAPDVAEPALVRMRAEAGEIHRALWSHATAATVLQPSPVTVSFVTSLNETIDLDSSRNAAMRNHVPGVVWMLVVAVACCGAWASGYGSGTGGLRSFFNQFLFPLLIATVITLIADIDLPRRGFIGINKQPLEELLDSFTS